MWEKIRKLFDYHRFTALTATAALAIGGCTFFKPTVDSILDPTKKVNRTELDAEKEQLIAKLQGRYNTMSEKEKFREDVLWMFNSVVLPYAPQPVQGALTAAIALLAGGAMTDNVRKNSVIKKQKVVIDNAVNQPVILPVSPQA